MSDSSPFVELPKKRQFSTSESPSKRLSFGINENGELEALKVQVQSLTYKLKECRGTVEMDEVEHEAEVNRLMKEINELHTKYESVSSDQIYYYNQNKELNKKMAKLQEEAENEKRTLEKQLGKARKDYSSLEGEYNTLKDDFKTQKTQLVEIQNKLEFELNNSTSEQKHHSSESQELQQLVQKLKEQNLAKDSELETLKAKLNSIPSEVEIQANQSVQRQLSDQIQYIKDLEQKNLNQSEQIKKLTLNKQNVEILKDEKAALQTKLSKIDKLKDQISDLTLENLNLKQETSKWRIYLNEIENVDEFFLNTKFLKDENLILTNNFDKLSADLKKVQHDYDELFVEYNCQNKEYEIITDKYENLLKINHELEQQKSLLFEESNFLREQLKNLDHELSLNEDDRSKYVQNLEGIIVEYKKQLSDLTKEYKSQNENSSKRQRTNNEDDTTRNFQTSIMKLKDELLQLNNEKTRLTNENVILLKKLESAETINEQKVRILQLRNNPFQNDQIVKREKLEVLEKMNNDLLQKSEFIETIPKSIYDKSEFDKKELQINIQNLNKRIQRLREIFQAKSLEFIDAVDSLLGFKLEFLPSNKIKLISKYTKNDQNCIIIDPTNQTLKSSRYNEEDDDFFTIYDNLISFWIKEKNEIPCFLSALNLELFEKEQIKNTSLQ